MKKEQLSLPGQIKSFGYAFQGLACFLKTEVNAWIHLFATIVVIGSGFLLHINSTEWIASLFSIGFVWVTEMINTSIEGAMDIFSTEKNPKIKFVKDVAAGAVLVASIIAVVVGLIVFLPYLIK